jgi:hypothetical protein
VYFVTTFLCVPLAAHPFKSVDNRVRSCHEFFKRLTIKTAINVFRPPFAPIKSGVLRATLVSLKGAYEEWRQASIKFHLHK